MLLLCTQVLPAQLTTIYTEGTGTFAGLAVYGNDLYIADVADNKIYKIDITASNPVLTEFVAINRPYDLVLYGTDLYVSEWGGSKVSKIDLTATTPTVTTVVTGLESPAGLAFYGSNLYIAEEVNHRIVKIDVSEASPTLTTVVELTRFPKGLAFLDDYLYMATSGVVQKIDITEANPMPIDVVYCGSSEIGFSFHGTVLYIAPGAPYTKIIKVDVSATNPTATDAVGLDDQRNAWGCLVHGSDLYIAANTRLYKYTDATLSVETQEARPKLQVFPNPSSHFITVANINTSKHYKVYSVLGEEVLHGTLSASSNQINIKNLSAGLYFLKVGKRAGTSFLKK